MSEEKSILKRCGAKILSSLVLLVLSLSFGGLVFAVEENPSMGTGNPPINLPSQPTNFPAPPVVPNPQGSGSSQNSGSIEIPNPLKVNSISALIDRIVTYIITIATILLPLAVIYAAYLFMSSGGDTEKITLGRKTILWTVVGYALILISKGVTLIVADILGGKK